jgi:hypothetical protein
MKMKFLLLFALLLTSCSSIRVFSDFEGETDFSTYQTFGFFKEGIDAVAISDFDKRRILKAIDTVLVNKGMTKSTTPDVLINFKVQAEEKITVDQPNWSWGWGWNWGWGSPFFSPFWGMPNNTLLSTSTEGRLQIDFIGREDNQLIWQGIGFGSISTKTKNRDARIALFVSEILAAYPPNTED